MNEDINDLIKPVICNGEIVNHVVTDPGIRVDNFYSSTYIEKEQILVKGEYKNVYSRNALLMFFDLLTGKVKGRFNLFVCPRVIKGFGQTSNRSFINSVGHFDYKNETYVLGSCVGGVEVFRF